MGVDSNLFINDKISLRDIESILKNQLDVTCFQVETFENSPDMTIFNFQYKGEARNLFIHSVSEQAGFFGKLLSLGYWGSSKEILTTIASTVGGFFLEQDSTNNWENFSGSMSESNGIPYFVSYWLLNQKGADVNDLAQFKAMVKRWDEEVGKNRKSSLKE